MSEVWVALRLDYDGDEVLGVFATRDEAKVACEERAKRLGETPNPWKDADTWSFNNWYEVVGLFTVGTMRS